MPEIGKIWVKVTPDLRGFWTDIKTALEEAEREHVEIKVKADAREFREKIDELKAEAKNLDAEVKIKAKVDKSDFAKTLAEVKAAAREADMKLDVNFKDKEAEAHLASLIAKLKAEARAAKIDLRIGTHRRGGEMGRGANFLETAGQGLVGIGASAASGAGSLLSAMKDNTVMILVAGLVLAAPALMLLSQALIGLPALIAAVALPIGVFALGIGGIKKALDDSGMLDLIAGKKGKDGKQGLGKGLKEIQQEVSDVFEKGLTPVFRDLGMAIPQLLRGLPFVAKGIVDFASSLTKAVITPEFISNFDRFTNSVSTMLTRMGPGIGNFASGMMKLVSDVGDHLPGLGSWLGKMGTDIKGWVDENSKPQNFWGTDIPNSSNIDKMVENMKPTLDAVKDFMANLFKSGAEFAKSPDMANRVRDVLNQISDFVTNTLPALAAGFEGIANTMKALGLITGPNSKPGELGPHSMEPGAQSYATDSHGKPIVPPPPPPPADRPKKYSKSWAEGGPGSEPWDYMGEQQNAKSGAGLIRGFWDNFWHAVTQPAPPPKPGTVMMGGPGTPQAHAPVAPPVVGTDGGAGAGKNIQPPKIEAPKLPPGTDKLWEPLVAATKAAGDQIKGIVGSWAGLIKTALDSAAATASTSGAAIGQRFAEGIRSSQGAAVQAATDLAAAVKAVLPRSPAETGPFSGSGWTDVFKSGGAITSQLAAGLREGSDDPVGEAHSMAQRLADAVAAGKVDPDLLEQAKDDMKDLSNLSSRLSEQSQGLKGKENKAAREGIKNQREGIKSAREELKIQQERAQQLAKTQPKAQKQVDMNEELGKQLSNMVTIGAGFAQSNLKQFEGDLGIGGGAISSIGDQMLGWGTQALGSMLSGMVGGKGMTNSGGTQTHIHVQDVPSALQVQQHEKARQSLTHTGGGMGR